MPELPEVETIVRRLRDGTDETPPLSGQTIQSVQVFWEKIVAEPDAPSFIRQVTGKTILGVERRGKFLHFPLDKSHLIGHLRMSGDMHVEAKQNSEAKPIPISAYTQICFNLNSPYRLVFDSIRKFGRMWYVQDPQTVFGDLGPEPLSASFTPERL